MSGEVNFNLYTGLALQNVQASDSLHPACIISLWHKGGGGKEKEKGEICISVNTEK